MERIFVGRRAKIQELRLVKVDEEQYVSEKILLKDRGRVRDITMGPDGAIYVVLNSPGQVLQITPIHMKGTQ